MVINIQILKEKIMKKQTILLLNIAALLIFSACAAPEKKPADTIVKKDDTGQGKTVVTEIVTGWSDSDTYTVQITASDLSQAIDSARTKILKDIIKVRYKIYGNYAKIEEIKEEFREPLKNGEVISQKQAEKGIEIYYRIRDRDLKKKFEMK